MRSQCGFDRFSFAQVNLSRLVALLLQELLDNFCKATQSLVLFRHDGQFHALLFHDAQRLGNHVGMLFRQYVQRRRVEIIQRALHRFRHALDVDAPAGKLGRQTRVLTFATNRQRQLVVGDNDNGCLAVDRVVIQEDPRHPRRAQGFGNEGDGVGIPFNDINLFVVEFLYDILYADPAHADAGPYRINAILQCGDRHLGSMTRFARDILDLDLSVVYLRHFIFQQAAQHIAMRAAHQDLRSAIALLDFHNIHADLFVRAITFARDLLLTYEIGLRAAQAQRYLL